MVPIGVVVAIGWLPKGDALSEWERRSGWLYCDGRALLKEPPYRALYRAIAYNFGSGANPNNPSETIGDFNIPDFRGRFLRGVDDSGKERDPDAASRSPMSPGGSAVGVGSIQTDDTRKHVHPVQLHGRPYSSVPVGSAEWKSGFGPGGLFADGGATGFSRDPAQLGVTVSPTGGNETRPVNAAVFWVIKFKDVSISEMEALNSELERP